VWRRGAGGASHNDFIALGVVAQIGESRIGGEGFCMVELKIQKIGDSLGVILPPEVLARLHRGEGQTLFVNESADGDLRISATAPGRIDKMAIARDIASRYRKTLTALSK
jgi:antitoxin component of MazEF toxin-antitoxin module